MHWKRRSLILKYNRLFTLSALFGPRMFTKKSRNFCVPHVECFVIQGKSTVHMLGFPSATWHHLYGNCSLNFPSSCRGLVAVHLPPHTLLTDNFWAFGKMLSRRRAHLQLWQPAAPARGTPYLHYLPWVSAARCWGSPFNLPSCWISQHVPLFPFSLIRQREPRRYFHG